MAETIGVIAGLGRLPHALTHSAKRQGARVVVIRALPGAFEEARDMGADEVCDIFIGQWGQVVSTLKAHGVGRAFLVGKISRACFFGEGSFDQRFQEIVAQLGERKNDDAGINGFVADLAREGIVVGNQAEYLAHLSTEPGVLGVRVPTPKSGAGSCAWLRGRQGAGRPRRGPDRSRQGRGGVGRRGGRRDGPDDRPRP